MNRFVLNYLCPLCLPMASTETEVKNRIGGILKYKKPGKWLAAFAVLLCLVAIAGCFFIQKESGPGGAATSTPTPIPTVTATPTPTSVPVAEPTAEPTATAKHTPTPLPPSDLTLLGDVTPETVLAVPMGQTVEADLDGDGIKDVITCGYKGFGKGEIFSELTGGSWRFSEALFQLNINGRTFRDDEIREGYWNDGPGFTTYYIFDVNVKDNYKEIGLYFDGPSGDPSTALYRYIEGKLYCVGVFESATLESDYSWNSMDYEDVPYEEMVQAVDRTSFCISVPGDGTIFCEERTGFFETTYIVREYKLWNSSMGKAALLQETIRDRYEFTGWQTDREMLNVRAARTFTAYLSPVDITKEERKDTVTVTIPEGTRISFYTYYPDNEWTAGWVQFAYGENLEQFAWLYKGVDVTGKFMIYLPDETENDVDALFENLSRAG